MGRRKVVTLYNNRYRGGYLSERDCDMLENIRSAYEDGVSFNDLRGCLYNLDDDMIDAVIANQSGDWLDDDDKPRGELSDSQTDMLAFGIVSKRWLCGDSVGLGKTTLVAALYNYLKAHKTWKDQRPRLLFLTEGEDVMRQNMRQLIRFTGDYFMGCTGRAADAEELVGYYTSIGDVPNVIATHSILRQTKFQELVESYRGKHGEPPFTIVAIDESAVLGKSTTQIYKQAVGLFSDVNYRVCLNATEFDTNLEEFYNQLSWVDDTLLPTKTQFKKDYFIMEYNPFSGYYSKPSGKYRNAGKFRYLVGYRYLARTRKDLGATIENCHAEVVKVPENEYQRNLLKETSQPGMALNCPWAIDRGANVSPQYCPKLGILVRTIKEVVQKTGSPKTQFLIYAFHKEAQQGILEVLQYLYQNYDMDIAILNGETGSEERADIIRRFKESSLGVLITNVQRGLNFGNCDYVIFYEFPSVGQAVQFEGRITRQENIRNKNVYVLLSENRELRNFRGILSDRAKAIEAFSTTDYSMVLMLLLKGGSVADV